MGKRKKTDPDAERVKDVLRIRLDGAALHDVVDWANAAERDWKLTEDDAARLIERADDLLASRHDRSRRRAIALALARRETLYARAINGGDLRTALAVLADLDKLRGLYDRDRDRKPLLELARSQAERIAELEGLLAATPRVTAIEAPAADTPAPSALRSEDAPAAQIDAAQAEPTA